MAVMHTASFSNAVTLRGIQEIIQTKWDERPAVGRSLFNVKPSSQYREHALTIGGISTFDVKAQGEPINYESMNEGFLTTYTHVTYAKGIRATHEMMSDELYGILDNLATELGNSAIATEETTLANHLNRANTSGYTGADGVVLRSAAHLIEDGTTYANTLESSAGTATTGDLSATTLETALINYATNFKTGGGRKLRIKPTKLVVATAEKFNAARLLDSKFAPDTDTNAVNPVSNLGLELVVWDYLTDIDSWGLLPDKGQHGLDVFDREEFNTDSIYDFDSKDGKVSGLYRQSSGWSDARGIFWVIGA